VSQVRIHGQTLHLRAKVHTVGGLSAHGDQADLLRWYESFAGRPLVCLVHGEPEPAQALQHKIDKLGGKAIVPKPGARLDLATMTMTSGSKT
jgi:metallo-beta-lactamase family protein